MYSYKLVDPPFGPLDLFIYLGRFKACIHLFLWLATFYKLERRKYGSKSLYWLSTRNVVRCIGLVSVNTQLKMKKLKNKYEILYKL